MFKKLFSAADRYLALCGWRDLALLKFCLAAMGFMLGLTVPREKRAWPLAAAALVFLTTYIPLMGKFFSVLRAEASD